MKKYNHDWLREEWERMGSPEVQVLIKAFESVWIDEEEPDFNPVFQYRIKSKPSINWDHVSELLMWLATGPDGSYLFTAEPSIPSLKWESKSTTASHAAENFASFTLGTCDWRDSLVMRPVIIGE